MVNESIHSDIRALVDNTPRLSITGQLRALFDDIEYALINGVSGKDIVALLNEKGVPVSIGTFHSTYARLKKERGINPADEKKPVLKAKQVEPKIVKATDKPVPVNPQKPARKTYDQIKAENPTLNSYQIGKLAAAEYN